MTQDEVLSDSLKVQTAAFIRQKGTSLSVFVVECVMCTKVEVEMPFPHRIRILRLGCRLVFPMFVGVVMHDNCHFVACRRPGERGCFIYLNYEYKSRCSGNVVRTDASSGT